MSTDKEIRDAFETQRHLDGQITPAFALPVAPAHPRWRLNLLTIAAATGVLVAALAVLALPGMNSSAAVAPPSFEEASRSVSHQAFAATAAAWQSPTDFLLDPSYTSLPEEF